MSVTLSPEQVPPVVSRHAVTFVMITVLLDMIGFGLIMPVLPALIEDVGHIGLADASIIGGWMYFAFSITQFLLAPLMGNLSDRFGRRPLLLLAILGLAVDYLLQAFAPTLLWLFIGRAVAGFCGSSWVIANAYIADVTAPEDRAKAYGRMGAVFGAGFVLGPAIGGLLGEFGPRVPFFVAAAISAANLVYGWYVLPETLPLHKRRKFEIARANPFGAFRIFATYKGVLPMCGVMATFFFATSVYPALWPFWGIAKFGWSEAMIGVTLAVFGVVTAGFQGGLVGPGLARLGEYRLALVGIVCAAIAALGYGLAGSLPVVVILMIVHGPEGFIHPMLTAMMSRAVPDDAQGELQGGISAITNIAMLAGTLFYTQIFGYFMRPDAALRSPDVGFFIAAAIMVMTLALFLVSVKREGATQ